MLWTLLLSKSMAKKTNVLEALFELAAMLPWWVGTLLAAIAYVTLHQYGSLDAPVVLVPGQAGEALGGYLFRTLAYYGQYIVPVVFLLGAFSAFSGRRKRQSLVREVLGDGSGNTLRNLNWKDFELLVGEAFRMRGFSVLETGGGGADGGIDLKLKKGSETFLVQCKQWRAYKVSVTVVRELYGIMAAQGATGGFVVTSGTFSKDALAFAVGRNIELINGLELQAMIRKVRTAQARQIPEYQIPATEEPTCPRCGTAMIRRTAKQGSNAGAAFWGCASFPKCRGVRELE